MLDYCLKQYKFRLNRNYFCTFCEIPSKDDVDVLYKIHAFSSISIGLAFEFDLHVRFRQRTATRVYKYDWKTTVMAFGTNAVGVQYDFQTNRLVLQTLNELIMRKRENKIVDMASNAIGRQHLNIFRRSPSRVVCTDSKTRLIRFNPRENSASIRVQIVKPKRY